MNNSTIRVPTRIHGRKIDRAVAKVNMKKAGYTQICKQTNLKGEKSPSKFSEHWREFI